AGQSRRSFSSQSINVSEFHFARSRHQFPIWNFGKFIRCAGRGKGKVASKNFGAALGTSTLLRIAKMQKSRMTVVGDDHEFGEVNKIVEKLNVDEALSDLSGVC